MGGTSSTASRAWFSSRSPEWRVLMLSLDTSGKSTIFLRMQGNTTATPIPTIGFEIEDIRRKRCTFKVWDISTQVLSRRLWSHYFPGTQALIFVVDSSDRERLAEAAEELSTALAHDDMRECKSVLIFANKQDFVGCLTVGEVTAGLGLPQIAAGRKWRVQPSIAVRSEGLEDGLDWLEGSLMDKP